MYSLPRGGERIWRERNNRGLAQVVGELGVVEAQRLGDGAAQAGDAADVQAGQGAEQADELLALGNVAEDVEAVLYLGVLEARRGSRLFRG